MARKKKSREDVFADWPRPEFTEIIKTNKDFNSKFQMAMSYAHFELSPIDLKKETIKYLKSLDIKHPFLERMKDVNENRFSTVGKYMYILNNGGEIPDNVFPNLLPSLEKTLDEEEKKVARDIAEKAYFIKGKGEKLQKDSEETVPKFSIQDRLEQRAREVAGEVEGWMDEYCLSKKSDVRTVEDFVNLFKIHQMKSVHMRHMQNIFGYRLEEIDEVLQGDDKDLVEGYCNFTKPELKKLNQFFKNLMQACSMFQEVAKVERAPRKKKPISLDKVVSKLKYKREDSSLGIVSQNPVNIPGAKEVWVYNTKTRKLSQYKEASPQGLGVKGASIVDYSTDSVEKTLRKPAEQLADFKKANKVKLRTFLKDLSTLDVPCGGKLNENHVILRIDK